MLPPSGDEAHLGLVPLEQEGENSSGSATESRSTAGKAPRT